MGLYDTLDLPAEWTLPGLAQDPSTIRWQTKSIGMPAMRTFRITADGRLLQEEAHGEEVPEEERPYYGTDKWDDPIFRMCGSLRHVHDGWSERQYHGVVRIVASVDGERFEYEAKFTDGRLEALRRTDSDEDTDWVPFEAITGSDRADHRSNVRLTDRQAARLTELLDVLDDELDVVYDPGEGIDGGLGGPGYKRWLRARNGITAIEKYLDWRETLLEQ